MESKRSLKPQMVSRGELLTPASYAGYGGHTLFTPKDSIRVGCWNVRSLGKPTRQNGRLRDVLRTMREKKIELLALSEVRWPGHGVSQLNDAVIIYSGMLDNELKHRRRGVAVVLEERAASGWRMAGSEFTPVSERLLKIRLKSHFGHVSVIAVYAPTNEAGNGRFGPGELNENGVKLQARPVGGFWGFERTTPLPGEVRFFSIAISYFHESSRA